MLLDPWFWLFISTALALALALGHNITTGAELKKYLGDQVEAKWALLQAALANHQQDVNVALAKQDTVAQVAVEKASAAVAAANKSVGQAGTA